MHTAVTVQHGGLAGRSGRAGVMEDAEHLLARSFHNQPHFIDMFSDPQRRARALPHVFAALLTDAGAHGRIDVAHVDDGLAGVAVWYPPDTYPLTPIRQVRTLPAALRMAAAAPRSVVRVMRFQAAALHLHPDQPYWYLAAIGVDPSGQGLGVGTRLLRTGLAAADAEGAGCYLETHTPRNVDWYRHHGFQVRASEIAFTPDGPPHWTMWRDGRAR